MGYEWETPDKSSVQIFIEYIEKKIKDLSDEIAYAKGNGCEFNGYKEMELTCYRKILNDFKRDA